MPPKKQTKEQNKKRTTLTRSWNSRVLRSRTIQLPIPPCFLSKTSKITQPSLPPIRSPPDQISTPNITLPTSAHSSVPDLSFFAFAANDTSNIDLPASSYTSETFRDPDQDGEEEMPRFLGLQQEPFKILSFEDY